MTYSLERLIHGIEEHTVFQQGNAEARGTEQPTHVDPVSLATSLIGTYGDEEPGAVIVLTWPKAQGAHSGTGSVRVFRLPIGDTHAADPAVGEADEFVEFTRDSDWTCVVISECPATNWALREFIEQLMVFKGENESGSTCRGIWATSALRPGERLWAHQLTVGAGNPLYLGKLGHATPPATSAGLTKLSKALLEFPYDVAVSRKRAHDFRDNVETELEVMGRSKELENAVEALGQVLAGVRGNHGPETQTGITPSSEEIALLLYLSLDNVLLRDVALNLAVIMPENMMCVYSEVSAATTGPAWANAVSICAVAAINVGMSDYAYGLLEEVRRTYREHSLSSLLISLMEQGREDAIARAVDHAYTFICDQYRVSPRIDVLV